MRDTLAPFFALVFLTIGTMMLVGGISTSDVIQTARIIGGAAFLSVGLTSLSFALKNWLKWKRFYKAYRNE